MKSFNIAVIAGDGIGKEVVPEGIRVGDPAGRRFGFQCDWRNFDWNCETIGPRKGPADTLGSRP